MRIISGTHKGRKIVAPLKLPVRPTTDMAKEGLFNILYHQFDFSEMRVLDLFSGTGNIAYEFASRRCLSVTAVDINSLCIRFIDEIAEKLSFNELITVQMDYKKYIERSGEQFDLVFADPPYQLETLAEIPNSIFHNNVLKPECLFILEHGKDHQFNLHPKFHDHRKYGNVHFSFFKA